VKKGKKNFEITFNLYICVKVLIQIMKATIYISGVIGTETTLLDVIRQYKSYDDPTEVNAIIKSIGGDVDEGDAIYDYLNGLKSTLPVNTETNKAYSISAKIFSVGDKRVIEDIDDAAMIHFAWAKPKAGKAEYFEALAEELREKEEEFAKFYAEFLDIDEDTAKSLLDNDTFLSGEEAVELGFATELKSATKAVAIYKKVKTEKMTKIKKSKGKALLAAFAAFVGMEDDPTELKALMLQDSNGTEIDFADLESDDTPKEGDKGTIEGSPVPDGEYIIPTMEEATVVFVDGAITEVKPKEDEEESEEDKEARLAAEAKATEINAEEIKEVFTYSVQATNDSFEMGDVLMFEGWDGGEPYAASSGEFKLKDGRSIVTDASGVIVKVKAADSEEQIIDEDVEAQAQVQAMLKKIETKVEATFQAKFDKQEADMKGLKTLIGSREFKAEGREVPSFGKKEKNGNKAAAILRARDNNN
jgi:ATP-dependent protease ClpP protease subunit